MIQVHKNVKQWFAFKIRPSNVNGDLLVMTAPSRDVMSERLHELRSDIEKSKLLGIVNWAREKIVFE